MKVVCLSDTHGEHRKVGVPEGAILIHAGDFMTNGDNYREVEDFNDWLGTLPHLHKIVIAGNHDRLFEARPDARKLLTNATYLEDESVNVRGLTIYGSPWQPEFCNWAFNLPRGEPLAEKWKLIPDCTDILVTHGPPWGYQDYLPVRRPHGQIAGMDRQHLGCEELLKRVQEVKPLLHVFGHIHYAAGYTQDAHTTYVNAAICDERYRAKQKPTVIDLKKTIQA